ncbi:SulP family inorganic anion transporter [Parvicella tangerina]|uniref:Bicarbonate transporter BicA n=1 Tax=Parvicella tangerina TaxID=2829795 RepID=A0A916JQX0_9FLAO|nr:SulP family inorganic anion transporter [Parvicella tangerina]CAG5087821.1 Bicarbonate transporter BicA [Parvicella tangerina]
MVELIKKGTKNAKDDILSGITVALALVPEAVAFAFVANIDPIIGLYGAFMVGIITAIFGGRPGMISGATGALAVVMVGMIKEAGEKFPEVENAGLQFLFATLILMGLIQILAGVFKLGKFVRLIPHPVMMGFVNGLAIVIGMSQIGMFKEGDSFLSGTDLYVMIGLVALTMGIMFGLPKLTKKVPAGLVAILVVSAIVIFGKIQTQTVNSFIETKEITKKVNAIKTSEDFNEIKTKIHGDTTDVSDQVLYEYVAETHESKGIQGELPKFSVPTIPFTWDALWFMFPYALILAAIGLIESLMTLQLVDELTETKGSGNRECIAQGGANIVNGFFGGMGGCAMIGQSMINVNSGGKGRLSGITAAIGLLIFILFLSEYIGMVPIAALVGVMFMVVIGTFAWSSFRILPKIPISDAVVIVLVSALTVIFDLAIAVIAGVIVSALVFSWENAKRIRARKSVQEDGSKLYEIYGPLFFGSIQAFNEKFDVANDPNKVVIDFLESRVSDHSGIEALFNLVEKYEAAGKEVKLKHLSEDCKKILQKSSPKFERVIETDIDDPRYFVLAED